MARLAETLPILKPISGSDFDEICGSFKISPKKNCDFLRAMIDSARVVAAELLAQKSQRHRREDRKLVAAAISALEKVRRRLDRLGPEGKEALREFEHFLSPLISTRWLHQKFSNESFAPKIAGLAADFEDRSLDQRRLFIGNQPSLAVNAVLEELGAGLNATLSRLKSGPGARGGRKRAIARHIMILSLIHAWEVMGRTPASNAKFLGFVENVLVSVGWPSIGIPDAVADALRDWRNRTQKKAR